jgi:ELWxxDGT repeat protein
MVLRNKSIFSVLTSLVISLLAATGAEALPLSSSMAPIVSADGDVSFRVYRAYSMSSFAIAEVNTDRTGTELWRIDPATGRGSLLKDINPGPEDSSLSRLSKLGSKFFFFADDGNQGRELWVTDGTTQGTKLLRNINPTASSEGSDLVLVGNFLYFSATDGQSGRELWRTDGTVEGTVQVADLNVGVKNGDPKVLGVLKGDLVVIATTSSNDQTSTFGIFKTSDAGRKLSKFYETARWSSNPIDLVPEFDYSLTSREVLYFESFEGLWATDGTSSGTLLVDTATEASSNPFRLFQVGKKLVYQKSIGDFENGFKTTYWSTSGSPGDVQRLSGAPWDSLQITSTPAHSVGDIAFFAADVVGDSGLDSDRGSELWRSDGTSSGTFAVADINAGYSSSNPGNFFENNGYVYFIAFDDVRRESIWRVNATQNGADLVFDLAGLCTDSEVRRDDCKDTFDVLTQLQDYWLVRATSDRGNDRRSSKVSAIIVRGENSINTDISNGSSTKAANKSISLRVNRSMAISRLLNAYQIQRSTSSQLSIVPTRSSRKICVLKSRRVVGLAPGTCELRVGIGSDRKSTSVVKVVINIVSK